MHPDPENFDPLARLLALKRHEQPPPGYFHSFSRQVIARIEAGERGQDGSAFDRFWEAAWLQRLWAALEAKPIVAGAVGVAACLILLVGVIYSGTEPAGIAQSGPESIQSPAESMLSLANERAPQGSMFGQAAGFSDFQLTNNPGPSSLFAQPVKYIVNQ